MTNQITILGATGMLGSACAKVLPDAIKPTRKDFDALVDTPNFQGWVINCIGAIPQRINDPALMNKLNSEFPHKIESAKVIQIVTDCVFSGQKGNYSESSPKDPIDLYGRTKLSGETARSLKIRCSIIGPDKSNASLFEWVRQQPENSRIDGYADHYWNGVSTHAFALLAKGIIETDYWHSRTVHFVPRDFVSKYELVKLIAKKVGRNDIQIHKKITGNPINRTLGTDFPEINKKLWKLAGFDEIPTIQEIVEQIPL